MSAATPLDEVALLKQELTELRELVPTLRAQIAWLK